MEDNIFEEFNKPIILIWSGVAMFFSSSANMAHILNKEGFGDNTIGKAMESLSTNQIVSLNEENLLLCREIQTYGGVPLELMDKVNSKCSLKKI